MGASVAAQLASNGSTAYQMVEGTTTTGVEILASAVLFVGVTFAIAGLIKSAIDYR